MKKELSLIFTLSLILSIFNVNAQLSGFEMPKGRSSIDIPFEYNNHFITINVYFNGALPLRFIFDTGAEHTILTERTVTDMLAIPYGRKFQVMGADLKTELTAYLVKNIRLNAGEAVARSQNILVLEEDYFHFEEFTGTEIHGILGADLFRRFVVKINYRSQVITLYDSQRFRPPKSKKIQQSAIEVYKNKPYLKTLVHFQQNDSVNCMLLLDTGASLPLLINTDSHPELAVPEGVVRANIGAGLGGSMEGYTGRIPKIQILENQLNGVIANFQDDSLIDYSKETVHRNGILGNGILDRFTIYIHYNKALLYLKPNRKFKRKFLYDKSGITLITAGANNSTFVILSVLPNSPAYRAGCRKGDVVKFVNGIPCSLMTLNAINRKLQSKAGKRVRLKLIRKGKKLKKEFILENLL